MRGAQELLAERTELSSFTSWNSVFPISCDMSHPAQSDQRSPLMGQTFERPCIRSPVRVEIYLLPCRLTSSACVRTLSVYPNARWSVRPFTRCAERPNDIQRMQHIARLLLDSGDIFFLLWFHEVFSVRFGGCETDQRRPCNSYQMDQERHGQGCHQAGRIAAMAHPDLNLSGTARIP